VGGGYGMVAGGFDLSIKVMKLFGIILPDGSLCDGLGSWMVNFAGKQN